MPALAALGRWFSKLTTTAATFSIVAAIPALCQAPGDASTDPEELESQTAGSAPSSAPDSVKEPVTPTKSSGLKTMRGTVVFVSERSSYFHMLKDGSAQGFRVLESQKMPSFGQDVEVNFDPSSLRSGGWDALTISVLGTGKLPSPIPCTPDDAIVGKFDNRWVEVDAVVVQVKYAMGFLWIQMAGRGGWGMANVYHWPAGPLGNEWWGAKVKIRGLNIGHGQNALRVNDPSLITVVKPGVADPFSIPVSDIDGLVARKDGSPERVKVRATILGTLFNIVYLRSGNTAFQADILYPFDTEQDPSGQFLNAPKLPFLDPGDEVEIVGSPLQLHRFYRLNYAQFKIIKRKGTAQPTLATVTDTAEGKHASDLITLTGRLTSHHETTAGKMRRETLQLVEGQRMLPVVLDTQSGGKLDTLAVDDLMEVTGLVEPSTGTPPWILRISSPSVVKSLGLSPEVARKRMLTAIGGSIGAIILGCVTFGWIRRRRRKLKERVAAIRDQNTALEKRVADRTQELETAKEELRRALLQERELSDLKGRFITIVSHEFRTPLGIIMSAVELLRHYSERLPEDQRRELFEDIYTSTRHMGGLMEQVLLLGRVEAGKLSFKPAPLDLNILASKLTDEALSATNKRCPISWRPENSLAGAEGDESLLRHIFSNLLSNAAKYSSAGSPVEFTARRDGDWAVIAVVDHGIGLPEEDHGRLFQAFHRGSNVGEIPGTGLGLVIVKRCAELHGGTISADSKVGEGTTFTVRLPLFGKPASTPAVTAEPPLALAAT